MNSEGTCGIVVIHNCGRFLNNIDVSPSAEAEAAAPATDHPEDSAENNDTECNPSEEFFKSLLGMVIWATIIVTGALES